MFGWVKSVLKSSRETRVEASPELPVRLSQREMVKHLLTIPFWEDKLKFANKFEYLTIEGAWLSKSGQLVGSGEQSVCRSAKKVHYGCGSTILDGWLNVDLHDCDDERYLKVNLLERHPFDDYSVEYGFSEDMLEHLTQAESIFFLSEVHRSLVRGGVLRLSFPGLEGVLKRHYSPAQGAQIRKGELEAYCYWDHIHFYSKEELTTVAQHLGFSSISFVDFGKSSFPDLVGLDTRTHQIGLNTYAQLIK